MATTIETGRKPAKSRNSSEKIGDLKRHCSCSPVEIVFSAIEHIEPNDIIVLRCYFLLRLVLLIVVSNMHPSPPPLKSTYAKMFVEDTATWQKDSLGHRVGVGCRL